MNAVTVFLSPLRKNLPLLDVHLGTGGYINPTPEAVVDTGGPENTYTKNLVY